MVRKNPRLKNAVAYVVLVALGFIMIYPLIWMFFACFKTNNEMFASIALFPKNPVMTSFSSGWYSIKQQSFTTFYKNTLLITVPTVLFTVFSSLLTAYGVTRFHFRLKKLITAMVIGTVMLPSAILIIPRYILFYKLGWLNTYLPFIVPSMFAIHSFYVFMMFQFVRGIPKELDEAALIDGCSYFGILWRIIAPLSKPSLFTVGVFQFMSTWNDFNNSLIYITSVEKYPVSLALRLVIDSTSDVQWNQIMAMSFVSILIPVILYFFAQRYFVEGVATSGIKG